MPKIHYNVEVIKVKEKFQIPIPDENHCFEQSMCMEIHLPEEVKSKIREFVKEELKELEDLARERYNNFCSQVKTPPDGSELEAIYTLESDRIKVTIVATVKSQYYGDEIIAKTSREKEYTSKYYELEVNKQGIELRAFYNLIKEVGEKLCKQD